MQDQSLQDAFSRERSFPSAGGERSSSKAPKRIITIIIFLLLVGAIVFAATKFLGSNNQPEEVVPSPTPTEFLIPTDTPSPTPEEKEVSPTPAPTSKPSPRPTTNPLDKSSGIDRSTISIAVQNGSGTAGAGSKMADYLRSFGYKIASIGNADNFDYASTAIQVASGKSSLLALLKKDVGASYTVGNSTETASSSADAVVIVGKE